MFRGDSAQSQLPAPPAFVASPVPCYTQFEVTGQCEVTLGNLMIALKGTLTGRGKFSAKDSPYKVCGASSCSGGGDSRDVCAAAGAECGDMVDSLSPPCAVGEIPPFPSWSSSSLRL